MPDRCTRCGETAESRCKGCLAVSYCSRACQMAHWPKHKVDCQAERARSEAARRGSPLVSDEEWHPRHKKAKEGSMCLICREPGDKISPCLYAVKAGCGCDRNPENQYHVLCLSKAAVARARAKPSVMCTAFSQCSVCKLEFRPAVRAALAACAEHELGKGIPDTPENRWSALQLSATAVDATASPECAVKKMRRCYEFAKANWPDSRVAVRSLVEWAITVASTTEINTADMLVILSQLQRTRAIAWIKEDCETLADIGRATMMMLFRVGRFSDAIAAAEYTTLLYDSAGQLEQAAMTLIFQSQALAACGQFAKAVVVGEKGLDFFKKNYGDDHEVNVDFTDVLGDYKRMCATVLL